MLSPHLRCGAGVQGFSELLGGPNQYVARSAADPRQSLGDPRRILYIAPASLDPMLLLEHQLALLGAQVAFDELRAGGRTMPFPEAGYQRADLRVCRLDRAVPRVSPHDQADPQDGPRQGAAHAASPSHAAAQARGYPRNGFVADRPSLAHGEQDALRSIEATIKKLTGPRRRIIGQRFSSGTISPALINGLRTMSRWGRPTVAAKPRPRTDHNTFDCICETPKPKTTIRLGALGVGLEPRVGRNLQEHPFRTIHY